VIENAANCASFICKTRLGYRWSWLALYPWTFFMFFFVFACFFSIYGVPDRASFVSAWCIYPGC
jgi:hypothetical protein